MAMIRFDNVVLKYPIYNAKAMSLRHQIMRISTGGKMSSDTTNIINITALNNVSFEIKDGDAVGLVGHNGSGKTTLLRTIAGIYHPISGVVKTNGRISTIIELGAGMDVELSGYENIFRMGMLLGFSFETIKKNVPSIEEFSELGDFLCVPVRTYSAGMMMRLMFAVATSIQPEIILIDEMFATGDSNFQVKAEKRMKDLIKTAKILVFASHSRVLISQYCNRVFELEHGAIVER